jgi:hypothetical protein
MQTIGKRRNLWPVVFVCCILLTLMAAAQAVLAAPKLLPEAEPGNCGACHGADKILPNNHPDTRALKWTDCLTCHAEGKMSLVGKIPGSHIHQLSGITCVKCHGSDGKPEPPPMEKCVSCHGSTAKLAEKTAKVKPENPHTSPHYGTDLDCNLCHHQHAKSENYCLQCHKFGFKVP